MKYLKNYKLYIFTAVIIAIVYFVTRLYRIDTLPIFTDEAIYMWWAQTGKIDASWRFISLVDGKGPFYIWLSMAAMYVIDDPLMAGRIISVIAGFFSVIGLFLIGRTLFKNTWVGFLTASLYIILPFALVLDRMALYDTLVGTLFIWAFYLEILLIKRIQSSLAFILALVLGAGMVTKSSAFIAAALLPTTLLLFDQKKGERREKFMRWIAYSFLAVGLAYVYYSFLRLTPFFSVIAKKNTEFVYPLGEWIYNPFSYFVGNLMGISNTLNGYITIPILVLVVISFFVYRGFFKEKLLLLIWFGAPLAYLCFFGKLIYPRHFFFATVFLLPLVAVAIAGISEKIKNKILVFAFVCVVLSMQVYSDYFILTNFSKAPIPDADRFQYINGWPAGGGVKDAIAFFNEEAKDKKISIVTQGTFGLMPYALEIYLRPNKNIETTGIWPITEQIPADILRKAAIQPTYVVFYQDCTHAFCEYIGDAPREWPVREVLKIHKFKDIYLSVYQVLPN